MRLIAVFVASACLALAGVGASPVQQVACYSGTNAGSCSTSGAVTTITIAAPAAGDALIIASGTGATTAGVISTVTCITCGGVTWAKAKTCNANRVAEVWYGLGSNGTGTSIVVTYSPTPTSNWGVIFAELSGVGAVDTSACNSGTSTTAVTTATITAAATDFVIAAWRGSTNGYNSGPTNSYTALTLPPTASVAAAYLVGSGSTSTGWTASASTTYDAVIVAFLPAATQRARFVPFW